ncbi:hypothetical protein NESM_000081700 [Novymonas esmeraldas]|uniref:EF-hand domain-containing protein n=1 Tax=Novymonas esmeraldas TaxID=1808958 RepID=A0AAW0F2D2_9TRYP
MSQVSSPSPIALATRRLRATAAAAERAHGLTTSAAVEAWTTQAFEAETERISRDLDQRRARTSSTFYPALYMRGRDPAADETTRLLRGTCKAFELDLRVKEIEKLDEIHAQLWTLLSADDRTSITMEAFEQLLDKLNEWAAEQYKVQLPPPPASVWDVSEEDEQGGWSTDADGEGRRGSHSHESAQEQHVSPHHNATPGDRLHGAHAASWRAALQHIQHFHAQQEQDRAEMQHLSSSSSAAPVSASTSVRNNARFEHALRLAEDLPELGNVLYICSVPPPRPDMQLFLSCPRNAARAVDITAIFHAFAKQVSLVKCEAELIMWDNNNDGRLSEDEVESYVRDLAPRIAALQAMSQDMLPFYCCTVSRRLFWDLDLGNRGVLRIHSLLQSSVMDEWVSLQLMSEDDPQNWFGAVVTQQLYNKFVLLDTRNKGTLNVESLRGYKKGLPTVLDDGLPPDTSPLCSLFIDRYFETNTLMTRSELDYRKFVDFVIAVELLPQCSRPHFFWTILDVEGAGVLTPMVVNQFFRETHAKLVAAGLDAPSRETVVQEVFDLIEKAEPLRITRDEFMRSPRAGLFVALLIDCLSFWTYENREQR